MNVHNSLIGDSIIATCANNQPMCTTDRTRAVIKYDTHEPVYPHLIHPPIRCNSSLPIILACRKVHGSLTSPTIDVLTVSWLSSQLHPVAQASSTVRRNTSLLPPGCNFKNSLVQLPQQGNKRGGRAGPPRLNRPRWVVSAGGRWGVERVRLKTGEQSTVNRPVSIDPGPPLIKRSVHRRAWRTLVGHWPIHRKPATHAVSLLSNHRFPRINAQRLILETRRQYYGQSDKRAVPMSMFLLSWFGGHM